MNDLQEKLDNSILEHDYKTAGETTVKMMIKEETDKLHQLYRNAVIELAEKDQLILELTQENQAFKNTIGKWRLQDESKM